MKVSKPLAAKIGNVIASRAYIIEGTRNFEKNGKYSKKGLNKIGKKEPKPVNSIKIVVLQ